MGAAMEYDEAAHLYRSRLSAADPLFRLPPRRPSAALSYRDDRAWYLRDDEGRLIARVGRAGIEFA